jgi:hypothetical protein
LKMTADREFVRAGREFEISKSISWRKPILSGSVTAARHPHPGQVKAVRRLSSSASRLGIHTLQLAVAMGQGDQDIAEEKLDAAHLGASHHQLCQERFCGRSDARRMGRSRLIAGDCEWPGFLRCWRRASRSLRLGGRLVLLGYQYGQRFRILQNRYDDRTGRTAPSNRSVMSFRSNGGR